MFDGAALAGFTGKSQTERRGNIPVALSIQFHPCVFKVTLHTHTHVSILSMPSVPTAYLLQHDEQTAKTLLPETLHGRESSSPVQCMCVFALMTGHTNTPKSYLLMAVKSPGWSDERRDGDGDGRLAGLQKVFSQTTEIDLICKHTHNTLHPHNESTKLEVKLVRNESVEMAEGMNTPIAVRPYSLVNSYILYKLYLQLSSPT